MWLRRVWRNRNAYEAAFACFVTGRLQSIYMKIMTFKLPIQALAITHRNRTIARTALEAWYDFTATSNRKVAMWRAAIRYRYLRLVGRVWKEWYSVSHLSILCRSQYGSRH